MMAEPLTEASLLHALNVWRDECGPFPAEVNAHPFELIIPPETLPAFERWVERVAKFQQRHYSRVAGRNLVQRIFRHVRTGQK